MRDALYLDNEWIMLLLSKTKTSLRYKQQTITNRVRPHLGCTQTLSLLLWGREVVSDRPSDQKNVNETGCKE